jgi:hypothetical protein
VAEQGKPLRGAPERDDWQVLPSCEAPDFDFEPNSRVTADENLWRGAPRA